MKKCEAVEGCNSIFAWQKEVLILVSWQMPVASENQSFLIFGLRRVKASMVYRKGGRSVLKFKAFDLVARIKVARKKTRALNPCILAAMQSVVASTTRALLAVIRSSRTPAAMPPQISSNQRLVVIVRLAPNQSMSTLETRRRMHPAGSRIQTLNKLSFAPSPKTSFIMPTFSSLRM